MSAVHGGSTGAPASHRVEEVVRRLHGGSRGDRGRDTPEATVHYVVLPSVSTPRFVLPGRAPRAAAAALGRQLEGGGRRRLVRRAAVLAARSGLVDRWPGSSLVVPRSMSSVASRLSDLLDTPDLLLTMRLGPPRANWKPVVQATDRAGRVLAFVKVGHDELTRALVRHETDALGGLRVAPRAGVRVPEVRAVVEQDDLVALVLAPLEAPEPPEDGVRARRALLDVVNAVSAPGRRDEPWGASAFTEQLRTRLLATGGRLLPALGLLDELVDGRGHEELALGPWHGDLNPGNVRLAAAGSSVVWDWERYADAVPVGLDLVHHDLTAAMDGQSPAAAASETVGRSRVGLESLGVSPTAVPVVAALHLLELVTRYVEDGQDRAGSPLGRVEEWALPALVGMVRDAVEEHR